MSPETFAVLVTQILRVVELAMEGQTPEQRRQLWDWYIADIQWWRKALKIDAA